MTLSFLLSQDQLSHKFQALVVMGVQHSPSHTASSCMFPLLSPAGGGVVEPVLKLRPPAGLALLNCTDEVQGLLS